jgi:hypothetical protein
MPASRFCRELLKICIKQNNSKLACFATGGTLWYTERRLLDWSCTEEFEQGNLTEKGGSVRLTSLFCKEGKINFHYQKQLI